MLSKSATNKQNFVKNLTFTKNARAAWEHILFSIKISGLSSNVLMPSYIGHTDREGSGVHDPVNNQKANATFYKLNDDLSVNLDDFTQLLETNQFSCALIIHYFGFCGTDMDHIKSICKKQNVILVEDCAHAFHLYKNDQLLGTYGDFSFYSLHKYLPTNSGGVLKNNTNIIINYPLPEEKKINFEDLEHYANADFNRIAKKRRDNYKIYEKILPRTPDIEVVYKLRKDDIPQTFPVKIKNGNREALYFYLMERDAPTTALYYRMIKEIDKNQFPLSFQVANEILNLPVHQDTDFEDIKYLCNLIRDFFKN